MPKSINKKRTSAPKKSATKKRTAKKIPKIKSWSAGNIKRFRAFLGMTRKEFAEMLGHSPMAVWYWENDRSVPREQTTEKLDKAYAKALK
jgi:DNA-binding transcriptional regulator YiaG